MRWLAGELTVAHARTRGATTMLPAPLPQLDESLEEVADPPQFRASLVVERHRDGDRRDARIDGRR